MDLDYTHWSAAARVSSSWVPVDDDGAASGKPPLVLRPPAGAAPPPPCELSVEACSSSAAPAQLGVELACGARLVEVRAGASAAALSYVGTVRGEPAVGGPGGLWRFSVPLPPGCAVARLKLLSLPDKSSCAVQALELRQQQQQQQHGEGLGARADATPEALGAGSATAMAAGAAPPLSQLDELRMLVAHAAGANGAAAAPLPPSLQLLKQKLAPPAGGAGGRPAAAAQAMAAAVAKGLILEQQRLQEDERRRQKEQQEQQEQLLQRLQEQMRLQAAAVQPEEQQQHASQQPGGAPDSDQQAPATCADAAAFSPSPEARWLAEQLEASVLAAEARLQATLGGLVERLAALEAKVGAHPAPL